MMIGGEVKGLCDVMLMEKTDLLSGEIEVLKPTAIYCVEKIVPNLLEEVIDIIKIRAMRRGAFTTPAGYEVASLKVKVEGDFTSKEMLDLYRRNINPIRGKVERKRKPVVWGNRILGAQDLTGIPILRIEQWAAMKWMIRERTEDSIKYLEDINLLRRDVEGKFYFMNEPIVRALPKIKEKK